MRRRLFRQIKQKARADTVPAGIFANMIK